MEAGHHFGRRSERVGLADHGVTRRDRHLRHAHTVERVAQVDDARDPQHPVLVGVGQDVGVVEILVHDAPRQSIPCRQELVVPAHDRAHRFPPVRLLYGVQRRLDDLGGPAHVPVVRFQAHRWLHAGESEAQPPGGFSQLT